MRKPGRAGHTPILTKGFGSRGQVDLIDFQSCPDERFKYILVYQDHGIKFADCISLESKRSISVAFALLDIFTLIGTPAVLQTDNGREFEGAAGKSCHFTAEDLCEIITEISHLWPECKIVHGRPRHSESQGGVERLNRTYKQKISVWLEENQSRNWSIGCKLARWQINTQFHTGVKNVPYILAFGQRPRCGISSLPLSPELMCSLATEAQLNITLNLQEDGHIEDPFFSWTSDHQNIDTTQSVEDSNNVCEKIPNNYNPNTDFAFEVNKFGGIFSAFSN